MGRTYSSGQNLRPHSWKLRARRFLGSRGHVVGMLFAIAGIIMFSNGLVPGIVALALVPVMYATGYFLAERPRTQQVSQLEQRQATDAELVREGLDDLLNHIRKRVPMDVNYRVRSIRDAIVFTLENAGMMAATDPNIHMVRRTATTYLPDALSTYLSLPQSYAEREPIQNGRTAYDVLMDQLSQMEEQTHRVAKELMERSSQDLVTHGRFISDRYATSKINVPDTQPSRTTVTAEQAPVEATHVH
jgi:hypothetical protein